MSRVRPMSFNTEMVQAILGNRKTVTRRRIKPRQLIGLGSITPETRVILLRTMQNTFMAIS